VLKEHIKSKADELGFASCRVTSADPFPSDKLIKWLAANKHGTMRWMERAPESRCDPSSLMPSAKSIVCCALRYEDSGDSKRARFARGDDYHDVVKQKLHELASELKWLRSDAKTKCCVDTSPILEKVIGQRAGIGWIGKNMLLINPEFGSWFVLGEIITDIEIEPDEPMENRCGACRLCLSVCPTKAIDGNELDAKRCISYLTIEHRGEVPTELKAHVEEGSYGCDKCQDVCPFNSGKTCAI
jgi:epoxyqueuosine reductase